jgi:PEP-CTERM motif-containing protein
MSLQKASRRASTSLACAFLTILLLSTATTAKADEIAIWNFNDSNLFVDHGSGTLTTNFNLSNVVFTLGGSTLNARQGDLAGQALGLQGGTSLANNGRFILLNVSTVGFANINISFATQATSTGFNSNQLQYSVDGINFVNFGSPFVPPVAFGVLSFDLSSFAALNNNPNAAFRIVFNGASSSSGNNRIDNIVIEGTSIVVPEPASITLLSLGLGGALMRRLRLRNTRRGH